MYLTGYYDLSNYDIQSHTIALVPNYNLRQGQLSLLTSFNYTMVDDYKYLQTLTISLHICISSVTQFVQSSVDIFIKSIKGPL